MASIKVEDPDVFLSGGHHQCSANPDVSTTDATLDTPSLPPRASVSSKTSNRLALPDDEVVIIVAFHRIVKKIKISDFNYFAMILLLGFTKD